MYSITIFENSLERLVKAVGVNSKVSKSIVLNNKIDKKYNGYHRDLFKLESGNDIQSCDSFLNSHNYFTSSPELAKVCDNLSNARYKRSKRLQKYIALMLELGKCYFLTLTFNDATLLKTNEKTRRKYVSRFLSNNSPYYIANIDYGKVNEREHYHAIVYAPQVDLLDWVDYGFANVKTINRENVKALANYVTKLSNHAIKDTCQNKRCIFSKKMQDLIVKKYYKRKSEELKVEIAKLEQKIFNSDKI